MAQFFTDFSDTADGNRPADTTLQRSAGEDFKKQTVSGVSVLEYIGSSGVPNALSFDLADSSGTSEIYALFSNVDAVGLRFALFASDSPDNEYAIALSSQFNEIGLQSRLNGSFTSVAAASFTNSTGIYYNIRLQVVPGSPNTLKGKVWAENDSEPASWTLEGTNSQRTITTGWSGLLSFASSGTGRIKKLGIGTNGDPAPTSATSGADALNADDIQSTSEVTAANLGQTHALTANDTESASQVSVPTLTEDNTLAADDVQSVSEVTQPAIGQVHNLAANDAESGSEVTPATIGQEHALTSVDISSLSQVSQPTLSTAANVDALSANDIESSSEVTAATIAQVHALTPDDVESASQTQAATNAQIHALTATDAESATQVSSPTLRNPDESLAQPINNTRATISQTQYRAAIQTTAYAADIIETNYRIEVA